MTSIEFSQQLNHFQTFLHNFAVKLTQNREKAKDLVQDTTLRAFRYKDKYQLGTNFKGWIATIMRNTFINNFHKEQKRKLVSEPVESFAYALESKVITANQGELSLRMKELQAMLDQIGKIYSQPFLMHHQGYEYKEIAAHLDVPIGTIKSRIYTAKQKMRRQIQGVNR